LPAINSSLSSLHIKARIYDRLYKPFNRTDCTLYWHNFDYVLITLVVSLTVSRCGIHGRAYFIARRIEWRRFRISGCRRQWGTTLWDLV